MLSTDNSIGCGNSVSTSSQIQTKIIGGQPSDIYDWPWVAALTNTTDGKKAIAKFFTTDKKFEANVWVTWVVRNLGEGVLGHANLGKGVVEVAIGSYGCDGGFQLFDVGTVEYIMTHELGHSVGLNHSTKLDSIMYPTIPDTAYEYCLLN